MKEHKTIRWRIIRFVSILFALSILISTVGCVSLLHYVFENSAEKEMMTSCRENQEIIAHTFVEMEAISQAVGYFAMDQAVGLSEKILEDPDVQETYIAQVEELFLSQIAGRDCATTIYFRLENLNGQPPAGFAYNIDPDTFEPHVAELPTSVFYTNAPQTTNPIWEGPFITRDLNGDNVRFLVYLFPVYADGRMIATIGMDVDIRLLCADIINTTLYETGGIILIDSENDIIYANDISEEEYLHVLTGDNQLKRIQAMQDSIASDEVIEYDRDGANIKLYARQMPNGMRIGVYIPASEIFVLQDRLIVVIVVMNLLLITIVVAVLTFSIRKALIPLSQLAEASEQIADGNMNVRITYKENDEIGRLGTTFEIMAQSIQKYFNYFHSLAYTDVLTGFNNKAAYEIAKEVIENEVTLKTADFSIIVMDVNNLKVINDSLGHEKGDVLLVHIAETMRKIFVGYPLYRIGGDEFCSIVSNIEPQILIDYLQAAVAKRSADEFDYFKCNYQVAAGYATYDAESDQSFDEVFQRADDAMYANKKMLKDKEKEE